MDKCEELAAEYGLSPREVVRWPFVLVEECWASWEKRRTRNWKVQLMMRGADPFDGAAPAGVPAQDLSPAPVVADVKVGQIPAFVYSEWQGQGKEVRHDRTTYEAKARELSHRPPTDEDDWDIPPAEIFKLAAKFPGAVKSVKT